MKCEEALNIIKQLSKKYEIDATIRMLQESKKSEMPDVVELKIYVYPIAGEQSSFLTLNIEEFENYQILNYMMTDEKTKEEEEAWLDLQILLRDFLNKNIKNKGE